MKNQASILFIIFLLFGKGVFCQTEERFDIAGFTIPAGWVKETGNDFVAYTIVNNSASEYARILVFKSLPGTGKVETDFDTEWQELVKLNYQPGEFTNASVSEYKDGWISKIGVAPFQYQNKNHAAILLTLAKGQTKMSSVFISNTVKYQADFENFGSSLNFGNSTSKGNQQKTNNPDKSLKKARSRPLRFLVISSIRPAILMMAGWQLFKKTGCWLKKEMHGFIYIMPFRTTATIFREPG